MKKWRMILTAAVICVMTASVILGGCINNRTTAGEIAAVVSDNKNEKEMKLIFWHYYNDAQKQHLDQLIDEYNETEGAKKNVRVEAYSQGSIGDLTDKIDLVLNGSSNGVEMANMSLAYRDMVVKVVKEHSEKLVDAGACLDEAQLQKYNQAYLKEGYINDTLYILPLVKSTELLLMNQTRLDEFLTANPQYTADDMSRWESLERMAEGYFIWTDNMTPDIEGDGMPFIGLDNLENYFIAMNHAMGSDIYHYDENGKVVVDLNEDYIKSLFLNYYIPFTKGYYGAVGKYRSDDIKQSVLAGYIGSSSSVLYFPEKVANADGNMVPVEMGVYKYPVLAGGRSTAVQQGAGVVVFDQGEEKNRASMDFIGWLTSARGFELASSMSYMPVSNEPITQEQEAQIENPKILMGLKIGLEQSSTYQMVYGFDFENSYDIRMGIRDSLSNTLSDGRKEFLSYMKQGRTMDEAAVSMDYDTKAEMFYEQMKVIFGQ